MRLISTKIFLQKLKRHSTFKELQKQELNQRICFSLHMYIHSMKSFPLQNLLPSLLIILVVNLNDVGHVFTCYVIIFPPPPKKSEFEKLTSITAQLLHLPQFIWWAFESRDLRFYAKTQSKYGNFWLICLSILRTTSIFCAKV